MRFNLAERFPLLTTKKVHWAGIVHELLWFLKGDTNIKYLKDNNVKIWNEWADEEGDLGPIYGHQWRSWEGVDSNGDTTIVDQIKEVIQSIKEDPYSRRHIVNAWNVSQIDDMALPPCHLLFQFYVRNGKLSCQLYQRSADTFLGVPYNIASYSLLTMIIARICGLQPGEFIWTGGDVHIYNNHIEQVILQLNRTCKMSPMVQLKPMFDIDKISFEDIKLVNYIHHPAIKGSISV